MLQRNPWNKITMLLNMNHALGIGSFALTVLGPSEADLVDSAGQDQTAQNIQIDL